MGIIQEILTALLRGVLVKAAAPVIRRANVASFIFKIGEVDVCERESKLMLDLLCRNTE